MLKVWWIQRVHILKGCLSDPEVEEGILYRHGGTLQLNHVKGDGAAVPIWIPVRGTSQQEGFHFHQAQWVTGNRVSPELFQAQGMTGVAHWNYQRLVDLKQPGVILPAVFDPVLMMNLNSASVSVTGQPKYPALHISSRDTGERFGLRYVEPGCRPVPLDFAKHKCRKSAFGDVEIPEESSSSFESSIPSKVLLYTLFLFDNGQKDLYYFIIDCFSHLHTLILLNFRNGWTIPLLLRPLLLQNQRPAHRLSSFISFPVQVL
ncbi:uncharacterized protein LOC128604788 [Ictalurus furcatus]|uniref:uncharacterized protein LOC128604788 n=1 Tax=Ictalurus furcatus TaxID=66913 RepID=UPI0023501C65|nr:uncharacterized protein LOC128604788 [Ictalurus furcatus]